MKKYMHIILVALTLLPHLSFAQDIYRLATIKPEVVFTPKGFDTNDNAQIVLYGRFKNICSKIAPPRYTVDLKKHEIYIQNRMHTKDLCIMIAVSTPYTAVVDLDFLPKGEYSVFIADDRGIYSKAGTLPIALAKSPETMDDHAYAQITDARLNVASGNTSPQLTLNGTSDSCHLQLREVRVLESGDVYDVLPIMELDQSRCEISGSSFEKVITLDHLPSTPVLLNIRTAGGQSIIKVIDQRVF